MSLCALWLVGIIIEGREKDNQRQHGERQGHHSSIRILGGKVKIICGIMRKPASHAGSTKINEGRDIYSFKIRHSAGGCDGFLEGLASASWALTQTPDDKPGIEPPGEHYISEAQARAH